MRLREIWRQTFVESRNVVGEFPKDAYMRRNIRRESWDESLALILSDESRLVLIQKDEIPTFGMPWSATAEDMLADDWEWE